MERMVYNSSESNYDYLEEIKLTKAFIRQNTRYLYLFENDYDIMFNELFSECVFKLKYYDENKSKKSTFVYKILSFYCGYKYKSNSTKRNLVNSMTVNIDDVFELQDNTNIEREFVINEIIKECSTLLIDFYIKGYTAKELAQERNVTISYINILKNRELAKLRQRLISNEI